MKRLLVLAFCLSLALACEDNPSPTGPAPVVETPAPTPAPAPTPEPVPEPEPEPAPPPTPPAPVPPAPSLDDIDINTIEFHHQNGASANKVRGWPIQSELSVSFSPGKLCLVHDPRPSWPNKDGVDSVGWIIVSDTPDGRLHAWTFDYYRPGSSCKPWDKFDLARDTFPVFPNWTWRARKGVVVGFMRSRLARFSGDNNGAGRSNIVRVVIPFV